MKFFPTTEKEKIKKRCECLEAIMFIVGAVFSMLIVEHLILLWVLFQLVNITALSICILIACWLGLRLSDWAVEGINKKAKEELKHMGITNFEVRCEKCGRYTPLSKKDMKFLYQHLISTHEKEGGT